MKHDTRHWIIHRATAIILIPIFLYFITQLGYITTDNHSVIIYWLEQPINSILFTIFIISGFYNLLMSIEESIHDYIHCPRIKKISIIVNNMIFPILGITSIYAIWSL